MLPLPTSFKRWKLPFLFWVRYSKSMRPDSHYYSMLTQVIIYILNELPMHCNALLTHLSLYFKCTCSHLWKAVGHLWSLRCCSTHLLKRVAMTKFLDVNLPLNILTQPNSQAHNISEFSNGRLHICTARVCLNYAELI